MANVAMAMLIRIATILTASNVMVTPLARLLPTPSGVEEALHRQSPGQNCERVTEHNKKECNPKEKSFRRMVGSGLAGCRLAYSARTAGENKNIPELIAYGVGSDVSRIR